MLSRLPAASLLELSFMIGTIRHRSGRLLPPALLLFFLAACRGNNAADQPPAATIAVAVTTAEAPAPTARPAVTPTATFVVPFPAPGEDTGRAEGDPTLPTRTPTPAASGAEALPAPVCNGLTPAAAEGEFYLPNTPERAVLREAGMAGVSLRLSGYVLGPDCAPIPGAWLDFWQADADGVYGTGSFRLRGHQFTDTDGRYMLETIVPGAASGRAPRLYVKVQTPGGAVLTTQLFFPDDPANAADAEFQPALVVTPAGEGMASFDFVVATP